MNYKIQFLREEQNSLQATGHGNVILAINLPHDKVKKCTLHDVLLVPDLAYNLLREREGN